MVLVSSQFSPEPAKVDRPSGKNQRAEVEEFQPLCLDRFCNGSNHAHHAGLRKRKTAGYEIKMLHIGRNLGVSLLKQISIRTRGTLPTPQGAAFAWRIAAGRGASRRERRPGLLVSKKVYPSSGSRGPVLRSGARCSPVNLGHQLRSLHFISHAKKAASVSLGNALLSCGGLSLLYSNMFGIWHWRNGSTCDESVENDLACDDSNAWWSKPQCTSYCTHQENFVYQGQYLKILQYGHCLEAGLWMLWRKGRAVPS